jgi:hypothetical protein
MDIKFKDKESGLVINNNRVQLIGPIWQVMEHQNRVLVLLDPDCGMRNGFSFDDKGNLLWTIERPEYFDVDGSGYDALRMGSGKFEGNLLAYCRGRPFILDVDTGKVTFIPGDFER